MAPDFTLADENNTSVSRSDFSGTGAILNFTSGWCATCRNFYSSGQASQMPGSGLITSVVMDDDFFSVSDQGFAATWAQDYSLSGVLHMSDSQSVYDQIADDYILDLGSGFTVPVFVFVDANLNVVENILGVPSLDDADWAAGVAAIQASQVPIPAGVWLFSSAIAALGWCRRRSATSLVSVS
jgi:hypothetical protein